MGRLCDLRFSIADFRLALTSDSGFRTSDCASRLLPWAMPDRTPRTLRYSQGRPLNGMTVLQIRGRARGSGCLPVSIEPGACSCGTLEAEMAGTKLLVTRSDEVMSGAVVFTGTRVPVQTLLDYLEEGDRLDDFLEDFPTVSRDHALAVLELAKQSVFAHADSSG